MHAIVYHRYGTPDVLEFIDIATPAPAPGEVLIRVHAASVNPYDWHFMRGTPGFIRVFTGIGKPKFPRLGADMAGVVEAVGSHVKHLRSGDAVFGTAKGAFAGYACARETELALKPEGLTFEQAASTPIAGITALQGLRDCGRVRAGHRVLINGAAGGVGTFAVQIAKALGAHVTGVCSTRNLEMVRSIGADQTVDYTQEDFTRSASKYDVLFDLVGNRSLADFRHALVPEGIFVGCGGGGPDKSSAEILGMLIGRVLVPPFSGAHVTGVHARINTVDLTLLADMMRSGQVKPVLDRSYPLRETGAAIRYIEQGHAHGKVTIAIS